MLDIHPARISNFQKGALKGPVVLFESVDSTNSAASAMAAAGAPEGTLIVASEQYRGRGRKGRSWYSSESASLVFSLILRPGRRMETLTQLLALSAAEAVERFYSPVSIKWPNDLWADGRKLAGILAESSQGVCVLGMGMDVNDESFPASLAGTAVSLRMLTGEVMDRGALLGSIAERFALSYSRWIDDGFGQFVEEISGRLLWKGETVSIESGERRMTGRLAGMDREGHLLLDSGSEVSSFAAGDVTGPARKGGAAR